MTDHDEHDEHDEIAEFFDNLSVADFLEDRAGAMRFALDSIPSGLDFDKFFAGNIHTVRISYLAANGMINPIAMLCNGTSMYAYRPTNTEDMGEYVKRLASEARELRAKWLFISRKGAVATTRVSADEMPEIDSTTALSQARAAGGVHEGVVYYAERFEDGEKDIRFGMMQEDEGWQLGDPIAGSPAHQAYPLFANILPGESERQ